MAVPLVKGLTFLNLRRFVEQRLGGAAGWSRLMGQLHSDDSTVIASVVGTGWYDLALLARMLNAVDREFGIGNLALVREQGVFQAESDLKVVFRMFFRMANPSYVISKATHYWSRLQTEGVWEIEREAPNRVRGSLTGWGVDAALCAAIGAYMVRLIELVGGKSVVGEHPACRVEGHPACVFTLRWRE